MKRLIALLTVTALMLALTAMPALAAPQGGPFVTGGLVNVTIVDAVDVNDNTVQLPIAAAANVCGVEVNLITDTDGDSQLDWEARAGSRANR